MSGFIIACGGCGSRRVRAARAPHSLPGGEWGRGFRCEDCTWQGEPKGFRALKSHHAHIQRLIDP